MKGLTERIANLPAEKRKLLLERLRAKTGQGGESRIARQPRTDDAFPLSFSQQRFWFSEQLQPGQSVYTIGGAVRLLGVLDAGIMENSIRELVRRHEVLRTTFPSEGGKPTQRIGSAEDWKLLVEDLSHRAVAEKEAELRRFVEAEMRRPFDLERGPLFRALLIRLGEQDHGLLLTTHHIISDAASAAIMAREINELYTAYANGRASSLEELPVQYADYAVWQRGWLQSEAVGKHLSYWKNQLAGAPPALDIPTDWPRPAVQTYRGANLPLKLPEELSGALRRLSRREQCTLFMTLLTALKILLYRCSGQPDIVVGAPVAGRTRPEIEGLIGCFIDTLSLRTRFEGEPTFRQLLKEVRETVLQAIAHQDIPFARLVEHLQPKRDLSRTPIFQVIFNMLPDDDLACELPGLRAAPIDLPEAESKFDFTLYAVDLSERLLCQLVYNADLFSSERMKELLAQYEHLLRQVVEDPDQGISRYGLTTPSSKGHLPDPTVLQSSEVEELVIARFASRSRQHPGRVAVLASTQSVSFGQLDALSNRVANCLRSRGVRGQDVVAVFADRSAMLPCALLGILKAGAAFTILDPAYPSARQVDQLRAADPVSLVRIASAGPLLGPIDDAAKRLPCGVVALPERADDVDGGDLAGCPTTDPNVQVAPDDLAYVAFTSGTTGRPKAIAGTHRPLAHFLQWYYDRFDFRPSDRFSLLSGLAHDPLLRDVFAPLCLGATLCVPGEQDIVPGRLREWLAESSASVIHISPALEPLITSESESNSSRLPSLRYVLFGGDQLWRSQLERLRALAPQATFVNCYGATETPQVMSYFVAATEQQINTDRQRVPIGRGIQDAQLLILGEAGQQAGIGELGEVCVRTPYLARGYVNEPDLSCQCFVDNPFTQATDDRVYRTGDLGRYLPDGAVELAGRRDRQVKIRGFRVEPDEVEAALLRHSSIREVVVAGRGDKFGNQQLVAYVVPHDAADQPAVSDFRAFLQAILPDYMLPSAFVFLSARPLRANGKVDYQALPAPDGARPTLGSAYVAPQTEIERTAASVWQEVLSIEKVGSHDSFFDLGGHSLLLVELRSKLQDAFQQEVSVIDLFKYPTVNALSRFIGLRQGGRPPAADGPDAVEKIGAGKTRLAQLRRQRQQNRS